MSTLLALGLANALCAAILAIPAYLVSRYGRRPALAHALWLLVLLKLITPPVVRLNLAWLPAAEEARAETPTPPPPPTPARAPVSVFRTVGQPTEVQIRANLSTTSQGVLAPLVLAPINYVQDEQQAEAPIVTDQRADPAPIITDRRVDDASLASFVLVIWLGGAIVYLARALVFTVRFQTLLRHGKRAPAWLQAEAAELAQQMGLRRCPDLWLVPGPLPPMVWGVGMVRILFPEGLVERLGVQERGSLLMHELAHIVRRDHWVRVLELIVLALFWWYPLAWWAQRHLRDREEECCDAWAAGAVPAKVYARAILEAIDYLAETKPRLPAMASALAGVQSLKERLTLIFGDQVPRKLAGPTRMGMAALAAAILPFLPTLVQADKKPVEIAATAEPEAEATEFLPAPINLLAPADEVYSVAFDREGKRIAAGYGSFDRPGGVEIFDVATRKPIWQAFEAQGVASVAFSPSKNELAYAGWTGLARISDAASHRLRLTIPLGDRNVRLSYSPDGKYLAAATEGRQLRLLDPNTGKTLHHLRGELLDLYCVDFSSTNQYLGVGGGHFQVRPDQPNHAIIFNVKTRMQVAKLEGHTRAVIGLAFAPLDKYIATASADNTVRLWDGKSFKLRTVLRGHTAPVKGVAFSPDSKLLATGSWDGSIQLWSPLDGKAVARLDGHPGAVRELAFSPDGKLLVSGGAQRTIKLWDILLRKEVATLRQARPPENRAGSPVAMVLSPTGTELALGKDNGGVVLVDARTAQRKRVLKAHEDAVTAVVFSGDGTMLATSGPDSLVRLWDTGTGKLLHTLKGHTSWVYALAFSRDGKTLASGSYDRTIRLWPTVGGEAKVLNGHRASVRSLLFAHDGKTLISGGADRTIRLWDLTTFKSKAILKGHDGGVRGLALADAGKVLISGGEDGLLKRWDLQKEVELTSKKAVTEGAIVSLSLSPAGQVLFVGNDSGSMLVYDPATLTLRNARASVHQQGGTVALSVAPGGRSLYTMGGDRAIKVWHGMPSPSRLFQGHKGPVRVAIFSPDRKYVLSCGGWPDGDRTLRLWDAATGKQLRILFTAPDILQSAAFTSDGKFALTGGEDGKVRMIEVATGALTRTFEEHKRGGIPHLVVAPDGKRFLTSSHDKTLKLWNIETGEVERTYAGHTDWVRFAAFHPDGKRIISGGRDQIVRIWDLESGKELHHFGHNNKWVESIAILPDGKRVLTGGGNDVMMWELDTGKLLRSYAGHAFGVTSIALSRDGSTVLSSSYDGSVRLWNVESGSSLARFGNHRNYVWSVALSPDGRSFLSAGGGAQVGGKFVPGEDFTIRMWPVPARMLAQH